MSDSAQAHHEMFDGLETNILDQNSKQIMINGQNIIDSQNQSSAVVKFILELKEINLYIAIQSLLDSLDIWLSAIKYFFDAANPASGNKSSASMYEWLRTPEGLIFFLVGGVFFGTFAFLGNCYDAIKKDKNTLPVFSRIADENWPFVRDCFKGLKWTFKGIRSVFIVLQTLFQQSYVSLITPFGVGFGVLAATNRYWNRQMIENRKALQLQNDTFRENIKYINTCFLQVKEKWINQFQYLDVNYQRLYKGCIIKFKDDLTNQVKFFYVESKTEEGKECFELKLLYSHMPFDEHIEIHGDYPQSCEIGLIQFKKLQRLSLEERIKYSGLMFVFDDEMFFLDQSGRIVFPQNNQNNQNDQKDQNYHITDDQFPGLFAKHGIVFGNGKIYRHNIEIESDFPELGDKKAFLEHLKSLVDTKEQSNFDKFFIFDKQLFYVTPDGWIARYSRLSRCFIFPPGYQSSQLSFFEMQFLLKREENNQDKVDIFHYEYLLNEEYNKFTNSHDVSDNVSKLKLSQILAEKKKYLKKLSNDSTAFSELYDLPKFQDNYLFAYVSAGINGILNAPYYFLGLLTMVTIPATFFQPAVGLCLFFMALNFIAEMYQEFDYQRRLSMSECKAKLSMIKRFISLEWDFINVKIQDVDIHLYEKLFVELQPHSYSPIQSLSPHSELKYHLKMMQVFLTTEELQSILDPKKDETRKEQFECLRTEAFKRLEVFQDGFTVDNLCQLSKEEVGVEFHLKFGRELSERSFLFSHLKLKKYLHDYADYQSKLKEKMILPQLPVIMQGIKNGLHCYGVFNGFLMTLASLAFLYGWMFGPQFFALSIGVGFFCVIFGTLYTALFSNVESKTITTEDKETENSAIPMSNLASCSFVDIEDEQQIVPYWYDKTLYGEIIRNDNDIQPSKNLLISEQFEVPRQFLSGFKKGIKFLQTIFMLVPDGMPDSNIFVKIFYLLVSLIYACFFALKGLRGLIRQDPKDYENCALLAPIFANNKVEQDSNQDSPRIALDNSKFINSAIATPISLSRGVSPFSFTASNTNLSALGQSVETISENEPHQVSSPSQSSTS